MNTNKTSLWKRAQKIIVVHQMATGGGKLEARNSLSHSRELVSIRGFHLHGFGLAVVCMLWGGALSAADSTNTVAKPAASAKPAAPPPLTYRPAKGSVPAARVTGGSRGTGAA